MLAKLLYFYHTDIDECKEGTDNCAHRCENTLGSYKCDCNLGCELASDGVSCEGINNNYNKNF